MGSISSGYSDFSSDSIFGFVGFFLLPGVSVEWDVATRLMKKIMLTR